MANIRYVCYGPIRKTQLTSANPYPFPHLHIKYGTFEIPNMFHLQVPIKTGGGLDFQGNH